MFVGCTVRKQTKVFEWKLYTYLIWQEVRCDGSIDSVGKFGANFEASVLRRRIDIERGLKLAVIVVFNEDVIQKQEVWFCLITVIRVFRGLVIQSGQFSGRFWCVEKRQVGGVRCIIVSCSFSLCRKQRLCRLELQLISAGSVGFSISICVFVFFGGSWRFGLQVVYVWQLGVLVGFVIRFSIGCRLGLSTCRRLRVVINTVFFFLALLQVVKVCIGSSVKKLGIMYFILKSWEAAQGVRGYCQDLFVVGRVGSRSSSSNRVG